MNVTSKDHDYASRRVLDNHSAEACYNSYNSLKMNQPDKAIWAHSPNIYAVGAYIRVSIFKLQQKLTRHISYHSLLEALFIFPGKCQGQDKHNSIIFCIQWGMTSLAATAKREITQDWKTACLIIMRRAAHTHTHTPFTAHCTSLCD